MVFGRLGVIHDMNPISIVVSSASVVKLCVTVGATLYRYRLEVKGVEKTIDRFRPEI
jgi:hypothetical protein